MNRRGFNAEHWSSLLRKAADGVVGWANGLDARGAWSFSMLMVLLVGAGDVATGTVLWMGPFYLLAICVSAWCLGFAPACTIAGACIAFALTVNGGHTYPMGHAAAAWNVLMRIVTVLAMIALICTLRRSHDRYAEEASRDQLTGALNRHAFQRAGAMQQGGWRLLVYLDLDGFKQINDRFGHAAGDATLKAFTRALQADMRSSDLLARVGGDEFLLLLDIGSEARARDAVESLRDRIRQLDLPYPTGCSIGALLLSPRSGGVSNAQIGAADALMYEAKRSGASYRFAIERDRSQPGTDDAAAVAGSVMARAA